MQFQADVLGRPVVVPEVSETTALGAAYLAGVGTGQWTVDDVQSLWREAARYEPRMGEDERESLLAHWRRAVERSRGWAAGIKPETPVTAPARGVATPVREAPGLHRPPPGRVLHEVPRARAHAAARTGSTAWRGSSSRRRSSSLYRYRAIDVSNVPERGPVLLAPNHFSYLDHFFVAVLLRREVQFMAKSQLFKPPVLDFIINHGGTFPVRRGQRDEEAFITAHSIFDRGGTVLMYAEGGRQRTKELGQPKPGLGRLALESGVPVVPVAIHGSQHAREAKHGVIPKVTVQFGAPVRVRADRASFARALAGGRGAGLRPRAHDVRGAHASRAAAACSRASAGSAAKARPSPASVLRLFLRTCQLTVISATLVPCVVRQLHLDRELDLAVGVEP